MQLGRKKAGCVGRIRRESIKGEDRQREYDRRVAGQEKSIRGVKGRESVKGRNKSGRERGGGEGKEKGKMNGD